MNELHYLKMFFKVLYSDRVKPIFYFFNNIYISVLLMFMTKKQKQIFIDRRITKVNNDFKKSMDEIIKGLMLTTTVDYINTITTECVKEVNEKNERRDKKKRKL